MANRSAFMLLVALGTALMAKAEHRRSGDRVIGDRGDPAIGDPSPIPDRTIADVLALLERAIQSER